MSGRFFSNGLKQFTIPLVSVLLAAWLFWEMLPDPLCSDPYSTAVYDRNGELLGARIAGDGQWRFPPDDSLPEKYVKALLTYEDRYFFFHPGVNPLSLGRALIQNIRSGTVVSGGSTLTMQLMRLARKNPLRTLWQKGIEILLSIRYELTSSKEEVLREYAANAPFGGNIVGLEAASWRYFGRSQHTLSWSEAALLAVLPNAPSMIHPGRNRSALKEKRDRLLDRMYEQGTIDHTTLVLGKEEPLPAAPLPLPDLAPHLTDYLQVHAPGRRHTTTLLTGLQERANELAGLHSKELARNQIHNIACMIVEVETGNTLAYVGNTGAYEIRDHGNNVDIIRAGRSTGSILKPFLFAGMLEEGLLLPTALVPDVPVRMDGYAPKNYNRGYEGAVPAYQALERSLNVPAVIMLKRFGIDPFLTLLENLGMTTFEYSSEHYGLSLILGGGEASLWELTGAYSSLARVLNHYNRTEGHYFKRDIHMPRLSLDPEPSGRDSFALEQGLLSAGSIYLTFESLIQVNRPDERAFWYLMNSSRPVAWKTGTSYGFRDAWAVGVTPEYAVSVWAGNADGEGRPGLTGLTAAAPLLFDLFSILPETSWFKRPDDDLVPVEICKASGYLAGPYCPDQDTILVNPAGRVSAACPYHTLIHVTSDLKYRVNSRCVPLSGIRNESWFVLPPLMEYYYKRKDPSYREIPPVMEGCTDEEVEAMEIVYPLAGSRVVIPRELDGTPGKLVMEVAHRDPAATIYWHVDRTYIGATREVHQAGLFLGPGTHRLTVVDQRGNERHVVFEVLGRNSTNDGPAAQPDR